MLRFHHNTLVVVLNLFFVGALRAEYIEGIDTTDNYGFGLDSSFYIAGRGIGGGNIIAHYYFCSGWCSGYCTYSFNDITLAPEIIQYADGVGETEYYCFIVKHPKNSTYSKVQVVRNIGANRYVFKYGTNTTPNDRKLIGDNYNRNAYYGVRNLHFSGFDYHCPGYHSIPEPPDPKHTSQLSWGAPLQSINQPLRYVLYTSKQNAVIDTAAPFKPSQWDSVTYTAPPETTVTAPISQMGYFTMAVVYQGGRSVLVDKWSCCRYAVVGVGDQVGRGRKPECTRSTNLSISRPGASVKLISLLGRKILSWKSGTNTLLLVQAQRRYVPGPIILERRQPDGASESSPVLLMEDN